MGGTPDGAARSVPGMTVIAREPRARERHDGNRSGVPRPGLAKLVKNDSLRRARAAGCTEAITANDAGNGPMPAVKDWFGSHVCATEVRHVRELD